ncbi:MAG: immunogenic protein [Gammaproteobacteria bacterium]|nr:MAG: immunogenic protein [Gammaproteobacteria bacterium]
MLNKLILISSFMALSLLANAQPLTEGHSTSSEDAIIDQIATKVADKIELRLAKKFAELSAKMDRGQQAAGDNKIAKGSQPSKSSNNQQVKRAITSLNPTQSDVNLLRIGSGAVGGNYFVLGELVGGVVSHPLGSLTCEKGGTCGIENLQTQNITSAGSVANLENLLADNVQTAFVQSDIAYRAYTGTGMYEKKGKLNDIRAIASLYPEALHIIVRKDAKITDIGQLAGKRVSLGAKRSGTLQGARLILKAYKLSEGSLKVRYLNSQQSIQKLINAELDAVFFTVGAPAPSIEHIFSISDDFELLSINQAARDSIFKSGHYFLPYTIEKDTYTRLKTPVKTISVYALWLTRESADEALIYALTKALWGDRAKQLFNSSYIGSQIDVENSLKGIGIPLHSGAKKYYNEIGKRF